jgi:hypothetical protein
MFDLHKWIDIATRVVFVASILHSVLPPWDAEPFQPFPTFIKFYKVFIYVIGYVAINARSTIYKSISTQTNGGVNQSIASAKQNGSEGQPKPS